MAFLPGKMGSSIAGCAPLAEAVPLVDVMRPTAVILVDRDQEILRTLALKVRLLSLAQLAAAWWSDSSSATTSARRRMNQLTRLGLITALKVLARPVPHITAPLVRWRPAEPAPDFGALAWTLQSRWTEQPRDTTVYVATAKAAHYFGGYAQGVLKHAYQATHDLGVAAVYLHFRAEAPASAAEWVGEDVIRRTRRAPSPASPGRGRRRPTDKLPDAVLGQSPTRPRLVIEFGGAYPATRVKHFHDDCQSRGLPYEIW